MSLIWNKLRRLKLYTLACSMLVKDVVVKMDAFVK